MAHAFRWEYSHERLKSAQLLGRHGVLLTCAHSAVCAVDPEEQEQVLDVDLACAHAAAPSIKRSNSWHAYTTAGTGTCSWACRGVRVVPPARRALAGGNTTVLTENDRDASKTAACVSPRKSRQWQPMAA